MIAFDSVEKLADELVSVVSAAGLLLIGVDGMNGAGKTTLAGQIAGRINGKVFSLDSYLEQHRGAYVPNLRIDEIITDLQRPCGPVLLEGACLLHAADRIGIRTQNLIYVKRMSLSGIWLDQDLCDPKEPVEDLIRRQEEALAQWAQLEMSVQNVTTMAATKKARLPEMVKEQILYHANYQPLKQADYVFHRQKIDQLR